VSTVPAPQDFAYAAELLKNSLNISIADDLAIESWIDAVFAGDSGSAARYWQENVRLSARATQAKSVFLSQYNSVRKRVLGRPPLDVQY
jgi:hypothetical protein